jgi:tryptophan-rich sensory protein
MPDDDERSSRRRRRLRQAGAWAGAVGVYAAAQGLSAWAAQRAAGRGTRPQYSQFERPAFAPPGAVFPVAWSALNLTTASSGWLIWRAPEPAAPARPRAEALAWWGAAVVIRSGYVPLAFGRRRLWAATADAAVLSAVMTRYAFLARRVDRTAALLAVPEVAWTAFATALSAAIAAKNIALSRRPDTSGQQDYRVKRSKREHPAAARDERAARVAGADGINAMAHRGCAGRRARSGSPGFRRSRGIRSPARSRPGWRRSAARSPTTCRARGRRESAGPTWRSPTAGGRARPTRTCGRCCPDRT